MKGTKVFTFAMVPAGALDEAPDLSRSDDSTWRAHSAFEKWLALLFLLTLPLVNPVIHGDGVGYYAWVRSLLIDRDLNFENEWLAGNRTFTESRVAPGGRLTANHYTPTGHVDNQYSVGPSILWAPFLTVTHLFVVGLDHFGAHVPADGYSPPYLLTMAVSTVLYGFLGLCFSFRLACSYFAEKWAFLGTVGIWFASALPVYMYFNPSRSHAHSAFTVALFLWYWNRTRAGRSCGQWAALGLISGLMVNVYYPNAVLLLVPFLESIAGYLQSWRAGKGKERLPGRLFFGNLVYLFTAFLALLPTLITRRIIYGGAFYFVYGPHGRSDFNWGSPVFGRVLFSSDHGLLTWTPIVLPAVLGLLWLGRRAPQVALYLAATFLAFWYLIASFSAWQGGASFGNRFFISLTPLFVLGLAASLSALESLLRQRRAALLLAGISIGLLIAWNLAFIFQWGTKMIEIRGPIDWSVMARNQLLIPGRLFSAFPAYLTDRGSFMRHLEAKDLQEVRE